MNRLIYLTALLLVAMGCSKEWHEIPSDIPHQSSLLSIAFDTDKIPEADFEDAHLFWFDQTDYLYRHDYYASMEELALSSIVIPKGSYTILAVLNVGAEYPWRDIVSASSLHPRSSNVSNKTDVPKLEINDLSGFVKEQAANYPKMLTGLVRQVIEKGDELIFIVLDRNSAGVTDVKVDLMLDIPSPELLPFVNSRSGVDTVALRGTAFIFKKGSTELLAVKRQMLFATDRAGIYTMSLTLVEGDYDVSLWVDYAKDEVTDNHYITTTSDDVMRIRPRESYSANLESRDAFSARIVLPMSRANAVPMDVKMIRPLAKYKIIATDVAKYEELRKKRAFPALEDLEITVVYGGFLPSAYSIRESKPADAETGYLYLSAFGNKTDREVDVTKDYVFVNGTQSSVNISIVFKEKSTGKIVSQAAGIKVDYRANMLTTIRGDFLTVGTSSGITIDTEWNEQEYNVEF